jgi:hypothetical protein
MSYKDTKAPLSEIAKLLSEAERNNLFSFLKKTKTSPRWYATNSFSVRYNNGIIFRFGISENGQWRINLTLARPCDLDETLMTLSNKERDFYFKNIRRCKHCNPGHGNGKMFVILAREYWCCAEPEVEIINPTPSDIDILCKFVDIRKQNILWYKRGKQ